MVVLTGKLRIRASNPYGSSVQVGLPVAFAPGVPFIPYLKGFCVTP